MKLQLTILIVAAIVALASAACTEKDWAEYKEKFNKVYDGKEQDMDHYYTFCDSKRDIEEHNSNYRIGEASHELFLSVYSDLTPSEREEYNKKNGLGASHKKRGPGRRGKTTTTAKPEAEEYDEEE